MAVARYFVNDKLIRHYRIAFLFLSRHNTAMVVSGALKNQRGIQSVEVGGALLRALAESDRALTLTELARAAGLPAAKAHPYLVSYGVLGLIVQDKSSGRYDFGPLALSIGLAALRRLNPLKLVTEGLPDLVADTKQTAAVAVWGSHGATVVHIVESDQPLHVNLRVGSVMSLPNTATGQIFAAYLPEAKLTAALAREQLADNPSIGAGLASPMSLAEINTMTRNRGLTRAFNFPQPGVAAFSAPVFGQDGALALAVTLMGPSAAFDAAWDGSIANALKRFAKTASERLGSRIKA